MTNKRTTWTPDHEQARIDYIESAGINYNDIHGYEPVFIILAAALVVFWGGVAAVVVMAVAG